MRPSRGVRRPRARAGWWRCHAWVDSITNTAGVRREPIGRISGRHTWRIGFLGDFPGGPFRQAFEQGLGELGYVDGQNIVIDYRPAELTGERLPLLGGRVGPSPRRRNRWRV